MYQTKEKKTDIKKQVSGERERPREQGTPVPGYIQEAFDIGNDFPGPARREPLAYTQEARRAGGDNAVVQRIKIPFLSSVFSFFRRGGRNTEAEPEMGDIEGAEEESRRAEGFEAFSRELREKIQHHVDSAEPQAACPAGEAALWAQVKEQFGTEENIRILISKILSADTTGVGDQNHVHNVSECYEIYMEGAAIKNTALEAFDSLAEPVGQTLNDIFFWMREKRAGSVASIVLTDSDIHTRGVGVCIVSYSTISGVDETIVVKPEDKSFEQAVYGKGEESLANKFNGILARGGLGEPLRGGRIGTLEIGTSEGNANGSAVEFFAHQKFEEMGEEEKAQIDLKSVESLVAFSSLLGLGDLHVENAVYSNETDENGRFVMQLIDAEIGLRFPLLNRNGEEREIAPLQSAAYYGELTGLRSAMSDDMMTKAHFEGYDQGIIRDFCSTIANKLRGLSSRLVIIPTSTLFGCRKDYLSGGTVWKEVYMADLVEITNSYFQSAGIENTRVIDDDKKQECLDAAESDFKRGRIPYYKIEFGTGRVLHEAASGSIVVAEYAGARGRGFLEAMIANRLEMLRGSAE